MSFFKHQSCAISHKFYRSYNSELPFGLRGRFFLPISTGCADAVPNAAMVHSRSPSFPALSIFVYGFFKSRISRI
jgi:hypothetical protein